MDTLRGYSGWGGCADAFSDKPEWRTIRDAIEQALTPEEYAQARASTLTAYYTPGPVVKAMWDALDIGPTPIQVLEPGCGTGNFMAGIPDDVAAHVSGVELDPISARIAAALNPYATILNADLADCTIQQGSFDLAIGNVPYSGDISLDYRTTDGGTSRLPLHDYFIERSVDALRPGGVAMLLTSRYTLDKRSETMRADLARKAELVGVVRLPSSTFARQAGTEAVTDVLVLRKRERTLDRTPDEAWIHSAPIAVPGYQDVTVNVNQAVADDMPAHAVGDIRPVIGRFGGDFDVVFQGDAEQVGERLHGLLSSQMQISQAGPLTPETTGPVARAEIVVRPDHVAPFEYSVDQRGVVWYGDGTTVTEIAHGQGDEARRLRGMIRLRDLARELQRLELDPARVDDPAVETKRVELDQAYDRFTGEFGRLNDRVNRRAYDSEESGRHLVMALEETDEKGRFVGKAKCLSQRTISPIPPMPDHADSLDDALNISLDRAGRVDLELIARLADTTVEEAEAGLGDRIIRDPDTGTVMPAEDYLTGDVGTRLDHVTAMAEHLRRRAGTEAMTEFTASTYATPEDMPATERASEWISEAGADVWRSLKDPYSAESYRDPAPVIERINGRDAWTMGWSRNPELVLALAWRAVEELPEQRARHPRTVRHRREEAVASAGMAPIARHQPAVGRIVLDMARRRRPAELRADPRGPGHARQGPRPLRPQDRPHRPARHRRQDSDPLQPVRKLARRRRERPARLDGHDHRRNGTHSHARHRRSHAARRTARHRHVPQRMDLGHRPRTARRTAPGAGAQRLRRPATRHRRAPRRLPEVPSAPRGAARTMA